MTGKLEMDALHKGITGFPDQVLATFPATAVATTLTAAVGGLYANGYGAAAQIIANTNTLYLKVIGVMCSGPSAADEFQVQILQGTTAKANFPVTFLSVIGQSVFVPFPEPIHLDPGVAINGKVACKGAVQRTLDVKLLVTTSFTP